MKQTGRGGGMVRSGSTQPPPSQPPRGRKRCKTFFWWKGKTISIQPTERGLRAGRGGSYHQPPVRPARSTTVPCSGICFRALFPYQNVGSLLLLYKSCAASLLGRAPPFRGGTWKGYVSLPRPTTLPAENTATPLACGQALGGE